MHICCCAVLLIQPSTMHRLAGCRCASKHKTEGSNSLARYRLNKASMGHPCCGAGEQIRSMPAACRRQLPGANDKVRENTRAAWLVSIPFVVTARRAKSQEAHRAKQLQVLERRDQLRQEWCAHAPQPLLPMQPLLPQLMAFLSESAALEIVACCCGMSPLQHPWHSWLTSDVKATVAVAHRV